MEAATIQIKNQDTGKTQLLHGFIENSLFSYFYFFWSYCYSNSFFTNIHIPDYFISFYYAKKICNSRRDNGCIRSSSVSNLGFVGHFHISPFEWLLYIYLYRFYIYLFLVIFREKYKDIYIMKFNFLIEIYKDRFQEGFAFWEIPRFPLIQQEGNRKRETRCIWMKNSKIVFDKKPGQVGWVEQEDMDLIVAESLQGLDQKLGIKRVCPVNGVA